MDNIILPGNILLICLLAAQLTAAKNTIINDTKKLFDGNGQSEYC